MLVMKLPSKMFGNLKYIYLNWIERIALISMLITCIYRLRNGYGHAIACLYVSNYIGKAWTNTITIVNFLKNRDLRPLFLRFSSVYTGYVYRKIYFLTLIFNTLTEKKTKQICWQIKYTRWVAKICISSIIFPVIIQYRRVDSNGENKLVVFQLNLSTKQIHTFTMHIFFS